MGDELSTTSYPPSIQRRPTNGNQTTSVGRPSDVKPRRQAEIASAMGSAEPSPNSRGPDYSWSVVTLRPPLLLRGMVSTDVATGSL